MILRKMNNHSRSYEYYEVPDNWAVAVTAPTPDTFVDCAGCGKSIPFGAAFPSIDIRSEAGDGYAVCQKCHAGEAKRKLQRELYQEARQANRWSGATMASIKRYDDTVGKIRAALGMTQLGGNNDER